MSAERRKPSLTLADALDATRWDHWSEADRMALLRPVGKVFEEIPWEIRPSYLGPAPIEEPETEGGPMNDSDEGADTRPREALKK
jgi:hypothetical protein